MLKLFDIIDTIKKTYAGERAKGYVADLVRFHRIQVSPGIREAAYYCRDRLKGFGLKSRIFTFPADGKRRYWSLIIPKEWSITEGTLEMVEPKQMVLCDYSREKLSVIQRTGPFDGVCDLVVLNDGEETEEYQGLNLKGKIVLTKGDINRVYHLAVLKHGAAGILYDGMRKIDSVRDRCDLADAREYRSFWWLTGEKTCFGFVLTPRQGDMIRAIIKKKRVRVRVRVKSRFYAGAVEVVSGLIQGQSRKEVVVLSHLCHPQPSANDNASGCGASLEIARTLSHLIMRRILKQPKRSIRFLYLPEMSGTIAYFASDPRRIKNTIAGINLDMVGENQDLCRSSLLLEQTPAAFPSFTHDLLKKLLREFSVDVKSFGGTGGYPLFRSASVPFSGGSDHYILSDPTVGIPCPMLIQWPDKFYHTSQDTIDKVDPVMLHKIGCLAASYIYFLAQAGKNEAKWLLGEMETETRIGLLNLASNLRTDLLFKKGQRKLTPKKKIDFYLEMRLRAMRSLNRLGKVKVNERTIRLFGREVLTNFKMESHPLRVYDEWERKAGRMIPRRIYRGPPSVRSFFHKLSDEDKDQFHKITKEELVWEIGVKAVFWCDGKRNLREISGLVELETGKRNTKFLVEYFNLLEKMGLVRIGRLR